MKIFFLLLPAILPIGGVFAQGLTQSADGKSTIPFRGTSIGLDIAKTELSFGYNNLDRTIQYQKLRSIFGVDVKVKNEEGLGNLFSSGSLVPSGSANLYGGVTWSDFFNKNPAVSDFEAVNRQNAEALSQLRTDVYNSLKINLDVFSKPLGTEAEETRKTLSALIEKNKEKIEELNRYIIAPQGATAEVIKVYEQFKVYATSRGKEITDLKREQIRLRKTSFEVAEITSHQRLTLYAFGGISAIGSFKKFNGIDSTKLSNSFTEINDRGGNFGVGLNYQWRFIWFGATYSYSSTNNFEALSKKDYTLRKTTTVNNQSLIEESKITGYVGEYGSVELNSINADIVFRLPLDEEYKSHVLINPYIRANILSRAKDLLPNKTNLGLGMYFLQGKFVGGLYVELPDLNDNYGRQKPVAEQNLKTSLQRFNFGIVTKLSLGSIISW